MHAARLWRVCMCVRVLICGASRRGADRLAKDVEGAARHDSADRKQPPERGAAWFARSRLRPRRRKTLVSRGCVRVRVLRACVFVLRVRASQLCLGFVADRGEDFSAPVLARRALDQNGCRTTLCNAIVCHDGCDDDGTDEPQEFDLSVFAKRECFCATARGPLTARLGAC